jgi:hypothetical protein
MEQSHINAVGYNALQEWRPTDFLVETQYFSLKANMIRNP